MRRTLLGRSKVETIFIINRAVLWQWKEEEKIFITIVIFTAESYDYIAKVLVKKSIMVILYFLLYLFLYFVISFFSLVWLLLSSFINQNSYIL